MALWKVLLVFAISFVVFTTVDSAPAGKQEDSASASEGGDSGSAPAPGGVPMPSPPSLPSHSPSKSKSGAAGLELSPLLSLMSVVGASLYLTRVARLVSQ